MEFNAETQSKTIKLEGIHINYLIALLNNNVIENMNFIQSNDELTKNSIEYCENTIKLANEILEKLK